MIQSLYHLSDQEIQALTIKEFFIKSNNIYEVAKLYNSALLEGEAHEKNKKQEQQNSLKNLIHSSRKR